MKFWSEERKKGLGSYFLNMSIGAFVGAVLTDDLTSPDAIRLSIGVGLTVVFLVIGTILKGGE